jgi:glycerol-1-phosphate dehydrogenase [NAD(P)+]
MTDRLAEAVTGSRMVAEVRLGRGVLGDAGPLFRRHFAADAACIIADQNTWDAAGRVLAGHLAAAGITLRQHILPGTPRPKPTVALADALQTVLAEDAAIPIVVGAGVLNDVVKYAAFRLDRPYLCVATAASMDGYTSAGAPLSDAGFKITIPCQAARVVLADLDVIAAAPPAMVGWGYGDLSGKVPAGADWIIAGALGIEAIDTVAWPMVQDDLRRWLDAPDRIRAGDPDAIAGLFNGLTMVGLAMEAHGTSRPASGADHQIAHLWEMEGRQLAGTPVSHGACVAVACVAVLRLYDWLLDQDLTRLDPAAIAAAAPDLGTKARMIAASIPQADIAARALAETQAKHVDGAALQARLDRLRQVWPDLRTRLQAQLMPADVMIGLLQAAGAPALPGDIGLTQDDLRRTIRAAGFIRSRYTLLDLLAEAGLFDAGLNAAFPTAAADARSA